MKVKQTYLSFVNQINAGRIAFFIRCSPNGTPITIDELAEQAHHFPRTCLIGEPFKEREEVGKLIKKIVKLNPYAQVEVYTTGTIRPVQISNLNNVSFNVFIQMKNSGYKYEDRIKEKVIGWFRDAGANFIFRCENEDDIDETALIVAQFNINKSKVFVEPSEEYLVSNNSFKELLRLVKTFSYNIAPNFGDMLWEHDGRA